MERRWGWVPSWRHGKSTLSLEELTKDPELYCRLQHHSGFGGKLSAGFDERNRARASGEKGLS